jgi:hypothetical protein
MCRDHGVQHLTVRIPADLRARAQALAVAATDEASGPLGLTFRYQVLDAVWPPQHRPLPLSEVYRAAVDVGYGELAAHPEVWEADLSPRGLRPTSVNLPKGTALALRWGALGVYRGRVLPVGAVFRMTLRKGLAILEHQWAVLQVQAEAQPRSGHGVLVQAEPAATAS